MRQAPRMRQEKKKEKDFENPAIKKGEYS